MRTRSSHPDPYGSVLTMSGFSSASALTSMTSPVIGASIGDEDSFYSSAVVGQEAGTHPDSRIAENPGYGTLDVVVIC